MLQSVFVSAKLLSPARRTVLLILACLLAMIVFAAASAVAQVPPPGATAEIRDTAGRVVANAEFREGRGEVLVTIIFANPPALTGTHGLRLHEVGRCDPPAFTTAGNGFNPTNKKHGRQNPDGPQVGDLPNVNFTTGLTSYNTSAMGATLGAGATSLLGPNRTALIIYSGEDDQMTDPDGKAGTRVACGALNPGPGLSQLPAASPVVAQPVVPKPVTSPVPAQPAPAAPPPVLPVATKPAASPIVVQPALPKVVTSPVAAAPVVPAVPAVPAAAVASPAVPIVAAVPTAAVPVAAPATQSSGGINPLIALLIAVLGVGLVGAGYVLRRRSQLSR